MKEDTEKRPSYEPDYVMDGIKINPIILVVIVILAIIVIGGVFYCK